MSFQELCAYIYVFHGIYLDTYMSTPVLPCSAECLLSAEACVDTFVYLQNSPSDSGSNSEATGLFIKSATAGSLSVT